MAKVAAFLAEGFEEVEALSVIDLLRRAGVEVNLVSVSGNKLVKGAHNIGVEADALFEDMKYDGFDMIFLPGGGPGTKNLKAHKKLAEVILRFNEEKKFIAAICAAPTVLGLLGILKGKRATCYPGCEGELIDAIKTTNAVEEDGHIITSRGVGTAIDLGLKLVSVFKGDKVAEDLAKSIVYK